MNTEKLAEILLGVAFKHTMQITPPIARCYSYGTQDHAVCLYSINLTGAQHWIADVLCLMLHHAHVPIYRLDSRMSSCNGGLII